MHCSDEKQDNSIMEEEDVEEKLEQFWKTIDESKLKEYKLPKTIGEIPSYATANAVKEAITRNVVLDRSIVWWLYFTKSQETKMVWDMLNKEQVIKGAVESKAPDVIKWFLHYFQDKTLANPYKAIIMKGLSECNTWHLRYGYSERWNMVELVEYLGWVEKGEIGRQEGGCAILPDWVTKEYPPELPKNGTFRTGWC